MDVAVLDIQILTALHREVKEVSNLIAEITALLKGRISNNFIKDIERFHELFYK